MNKLITCGLWFNKKKLEMLVMLDKFSDMINHLAEEGISCTIKGKERLVKLYVLSCCGDAVARAPIQGIKQFNGKFGCNWCLHPGHFAGGSMRYPLLDETPAPRNHLETVDLMKQSNPESPIHGIKYPSPLINLESFDIIQGFDYMHCCLEGVDCQLTSYYLQSMRESEIDELDKQMKSITAPRQLES